MSINLKKFTRSVLTAGLVFGAAAAFAETFSPAVDNAEPCPVNAAYPGKMSLDGSVMLGDVPTDMVIDAEFGAGAQAITQCLKERKKAKLVVRVDDTFRRDAFGAARLNAATYLSDIDKMINQYENTHAMKIGTDVDIRVVFSGTGAILATKAHPVFAGAAMRFNAANAAAIAAGTVQAMPVSPVNPYLSKIQQGMDAGIIFYLCQEASRSLGINMNNKVEGINFVPAAHAATADFIQDGYAIILP